MAVIFAEGPATFTAVGDGQAPGVGALYSKYGRFSIRGGGRGTVAVQRNFLGLSKDDLRQYGSRIQVAPADDGLATNTGGPSPPYSVSDFGDRNIQKTPGVAFDVYRWEKATHPLRYGQGHFPTTVTFPEGIGATCPPGWRQW